MDLDPLRILAAIVFVFFLPGYFLWKALVPRPKDIADEFGAVYTAAFSMALSLAATVLTGIFLGNLGTNAATGRGYIVDFNPVALALLSAFAAAAAWYRGAFPGLGRISPALERRPKPPPDGSGVSDEPKRYWREQEFVGRRLELRAQLKRVERSRPTTPEERAERQRRKAQVASELADVDKELESLRAERELAIQRAEEEAETAESKRRERRDAALKFLRVKRPEGNADAAPERK
jgi:hypothetical protein